MGAVLSLPSSLVIVFGLLVSHAPIMGNHHKPYLILGWVCTSAGFGLLASAKHLGFDQVLFFLLIAVFGMNLSNTATSLLIIKRGQQEHHKSSGRFMATTLI